MRTFEQKYKPMQKTESASAARPSLPFAGQSREASSILHVQRTIGNQAVQRFLQADREHLEASSASNNASGFSHDFSRIPASRLILQTLPGNLTINEPGNRLEREANRIAEQVMGRPVRQTRQPRQKRKLLKIDHTQADGAGETVATPLLREVLRSSGRPLDPETTAYFEPRFGHDFSHVRVHTDSLAAQSSRDMNARAYSVGEHIVFGAGEYALGTTSGVRRLAHELAHVVQHRGASGGPPPVLQREETKEKSSRQLGMKLVEYPDGKKAVEVVEEWREGGGIASTYLGMAKVVGVFEDVVAKALVDSGHYKSEWYVKFRLKVGTRIIVDKGKITSVSVRGLARICAEDTWTPISLPSSADFYHGRFKGEYACMGVSDPAEIIMCRSAVARKERGVTQLTEPIQKIEDLFTTLDGIAEAYEQSSGRKPIPFLSELHIHGHGTINSYRFGKKYTLDDLKRYETGRLQAYLKPGSTIYLEGCLIARNEPFLCEVGRIMFGSTKGKIWASGAKVPAWLRLKPLELATKTLEYPKDCKKKVEGVTE